MFLKRLSLVLAVAVVLAVLVVQSARSQEGIYRVVLEVTGLT